MRQLRGVRFLRQYVIGNFILDFVAPSIGLAIELDGGQHYEHEAKRYDSVRADWLSSQGICVVRYTNSDVAEEFEAVLSDIESIVSRNQSHPPDASHRPPSSRRG